MKKLIILTALMLLLQTSAKSQILTTWEELWEELVSGEDMDEDALDDAYEQLAQLARNPLDLNRATREDLEQLPFLSAQQVADMLEYCYRYGPVRSLGELRMVKSLDVRQLVMLPFFVYVADEEPYGVGNAASPRPPKLKSELTLTGRIPFQDRHGDIQGYLGYKYRHSLRYELSMGDKLKAGLTGAQDAGEPFFANKNKWGYDAYSYYIQASKIGIADKFIVGTYKLSAGMGLVLGSSLFMGKLAGMQTLGRQTATLRPHSSRSQTDYFRGAAATFGLLRKKGSTSTSPLTLMAFVSYRPTDATLSADGTATTLDYDGYHRTETEMERKNNTHLTAWGGRIAFNNNGWKAAINAVATHIDRELCPQQPQLYRQYYPSGTDFFNASADYSYTVSRLYVGGETAVNKQGAVATVNSVGWQPRSDISFMALWRYYSYRYNGLYSHSFGDNSTAQNESGIFLGTTWKPVRRLLVEAYADYVYFPWAKYLVSQTSRAYDFLLQTEYRLPRWRVLAKGRARLRQRDTETKTALTANNEYNLRFAATYDTQTGWNLRTQLDGSRTFYLKENLGWMASQHLTWQKNNWQLCATAAYFDTDDYTSRIYLYERLMAYDYYFHSYFGQGIHFALMARTDIGRQLRLALRMDYTNYFDRSTIGTGLQKTDHSHLTNLELQLRWKI